MVGLSQDYQKINQWMIVEEDTRPLTEDKSFCVSDTFPDTYFSLTQDWVHATFLDQTIHMYYY